MAELAKSMKAFLKEKEAKEKRQKDLSEKETPKAKEVLKQAEMELKARAAEKAEKGLSPEQLATVENSIKEAAEKVTRATAGVSALEKEAKAIATSLKSTHSATEIKKREQAMAKAKLEFETNSFAWQKVKAKLGNQSKILARAKKKSAELAGMIDPSSIRDFGGRAGEGVELPVSLEARTELRHPDRYRYGGGRRFENQGDHH